MRKSPRRPRRGATLIELLVALLLLDLALLSLASMSAVAAKRIADAGRRSRAAVAAANRLERTAAHPCASMTGGVGFVEAGITEMWSVRRLQGGAEISDSIDLRGSLQEQVVVRMRVPC